MTATLTPIVAKLSDMRIVNGDLENMVFEPRKEFIVMQILVLGNIPLLYFLNQEWYDTGGNNVPLVAQRDDTFCITGNAIDRQPMNGGNGIGYQQGIAYTLTATDHHAVFSRQRVDVFKDDDVASTQSARQHKDATDLVMNLGEAQNDSKPENETLVLLIRRLTPLECERLQGFPDGWTDIEGASDSARYKALGNSVAIPCVDYVLQGIAWAITAQTA